MTGRVFEMPRKTLVASPGTRQIASMLGGRASEDDAGANASSSLASLPILHSGVSAFASPNRFTAMTGFVSGASQDSFAHPRSHRLPRWLRADHEHITPHVDARRPRRVDHLPARRLKPEKPRRNLRRRLLVESRMRRRSYIRRGVGVALCCAPLLLLVASLVRALTGPPTELPVLASSVIFVGTAIAGLNMYLSIGRGLRICVLPRGWPGRRRARYRRLSLVSHRDVEGPLPLGPTKPECFLFHSSSAATQPAPPQ